MSAPDHTTHAPLRHRCVLWHSPQVAPDPDLIAALMSRRMHVVACANEFDALAHVCASARQATPRGTHAAAPATILVLSDPGELPGVVEVVALAGRYAARAACWTFEASGSRRLRPIERADIEQWKRGGRASPDAIDLSLDAIADPLAGRLGTLGGDPEPRTAMEPGMESPESSGTETEPVSSSLPRLRLAGEGPIATPANEIISSVGNNLHHTGNSGGVRQQLSDEELQMLLATDPERGQN